MTELYDTIGHRYAALRQPDPRIQQAIRLGLGDAQHILNVGAGAGSYEPQDCRVVTVEPSVSMIRQRAADAALLVRASAMDLPFLDQAFDASLAILTIHHWPDWRKGLQQLKRVARKRVVILTWDPSTTRFWLTDDYFPELIAIDRQIFPTIEDLRRELGQLAVSSVPIPHDCLDGFLGAYWRRPEAYLDSSVRGAISTFAKLSSTEPGLERLRRDLSSGDWHRRNAAILSRQSLDLGYRLVVAS